MTTMEILSRLTTQRMPLKISGTFLRNKRCFCIFNCDRKQHYDQSRHSKTHNSSSSIFVRFFRSFKWYPIPVTLGFAYLGYQQLNHVINREELKIKQASHVEEIQAENWQVAAYRSLPLKSTSRLYGKLCSLNIPEPLRSPIYSLYIWLFNCDMSEAAIRDLKHYKTFQDFFTRRLSPSVRQINRTSPLVSPSDGKVLYCGRARAGLVEQVKGLTYPLKVFLGPQTWSQEGDAESMSGQLQGEACSQRTSNLADHSYQTRLKRRAGNELYHCVLYLAPGDYHGFHAPARCTLTYRRHFPGELLSVNPGIAGWIRGLFNLNERVVYFGEWQHGFFALAAVGATNVGSVRVYFDKDLKTNAAEKTPSGAFIDRRFDLQISGIDMKAGEAFGEFRLGSTIVLIFEAPKDFEFTIEPGQSIKYGQSLGECASNS